MVPQDKYKAHGCLAIPQKTFDLIFRNFRAETRLSDKELYDAGIDNLLLIDHSSHLFCLYVEQPVDDPTRAQSERKQPTS